MPLPLASELAASLEPPLPRRDYPASFFTPYGQVIQSAIKPNEAQRIAAAATQPTGLEYQEPDSLLAGLNTEGLGSRGKPPISASTRPATTAPTAPVPSAVAPQASPAGSIVPVSQVVSGLTATPNYYLGNTPVSYGTAVDSPANAALGVKPGAQGGGGKPPSQGMNAQQGALANIALSSLSGAATSYAQSQAQPAPTMEVVQPQQIDFPIMTLQPRAQLMG